VRRAFVGYHSVCGDSGRNGLLQALKLLCVNCGFARSADGRLIGEMRYEVLGRYFETGSWRQGTVREAEVMMMQSSATLPRCA